MRGGNRVLARLARRSITKSPLRSLLIVLLITLVVSVGTGVAIVMRSATQTTADHAAATHGSADLLVLIGPGTVNQVSSILDGPLVVDGTYVEPGWDRYDELRSQGIERQQDAREWLATQAGPVDIAALELALQAPVMVNRVAEFGPSGGPFFPWQTPFVFGGAISDIDMANPLADGLLELVDGRFPQTSREIAVAPSLRDLSQVDIGDTFPHAGVDFEVVGIVASPFSTPQRTSVVTPDGFDDLSVRPDSVLYVFRAGPRPTSSGPLTDDAAGVLIADVLGWPLEAQVAPSAAFMSASYDDDESAIRLVPALVSVVLGIQMALVAATAFAVGVRRRTKEFGQLVTTGMDGRQLRRMVLFEAALLGLIGAALGVVVGVVGVTQVIPWRWISEVGGRYVASPRWNVIDWLAPAAIGVLAALAAAWWPARSLMKAPVLSTLAGHVPAGKLRSATPRWGVVVVAVGLASVGALAALPSADQASLAFSVVFVVAVIGTFLGTLLLIGSVLAAVNNRSGGLPLLPRLVVRSSDRHRTRSWMVVGAFVATLAMPVLVGASMKAYPDSYSVNSTGEFDRRLVSVNDEPLDDEAVLAGTGFDDVRIDDDLRASVAAFRSDLATMLTQEFGALRSAAITEINGPKLLVRGPNGVIRGTGGTVAIITPGITELLELPDTLADQVQGDTVLYLGTERLRNQQEAFTFVDTGPGLLEVDVIDGPALSTNYQTLLVAPEFAARLDQFGSRERVLFSFAEPLASERVVELYVRANELWVDRFGLFDMPSGATIATEDAIAQDWVQRQTGMYLQDSFRSGPTEAQLRWGSLALSTLLAALIAIITASLAAVELDGEMQSMIATGAAPVMRRKMLGAQSVYHLLLAAVLAVPLAILLFYVVSRADDNGPTGPTVPWSAIALTVVVIPAVVGVLITLIFRNGRPAVSRRLS